MDIINYSSFRKNLSSFIDKVNDDHMPVMITRQSGEGAVMMSLKDFRAYEETAYLMASPTNATRLHEAIHELEQGRGETHDLISS